MARIRPKPIRYEGTRQQQIEAEGAKCRLADLRKRQAECCAELKATMRKHAASKVDFDRLEGDAEIIAEALFEERIAVAKSEWDAAEEAILESTASEAVSDRRAYHERVVA